MKLRNEKGLGLVFLLLVLMAIATVAVTVVINFTRNWDEWASRHTKDQLTYVTPRIFSSLVSTQSLAFRRYFWDVGSLPTGLDDLVTKPTGVTACTFNVAFGILTGWCGPYVEAHFQGQPVFKDGWGRDLIYDSVNRKVRSKGPNGIDDSGGGDDLVASF